MSTNVKKLLCSLLVTISAFALASCGSKSHISMERAKRTEATGPSWTVLVYMCGGDAESQDGMASDCIMEMTDIEYPENVNVIVETGGSAQWHMDGIYPDYLQRFEMQKGGMCLVDQKMADNMGYYKTLTDFLSWGVDTYPADRYMAVIWNHGGGCMSGLAYDELYNDDCLNLEELSYAISLCGETFDIIGLDAGMSANLETAAALAPYGDFMVASAEFAPPCWDYGAAVQCLIDYPNGVTGDICRVICDAAYKKCEGKSSADIVSLSVTDLSKISTLAQSFDGLAGVMLTSTASIESCARLQRNLEYAHVYGANSPEEGYSNVVDLGNLASIVQEDTGLTSDILSESLNDAVPYKINGKYHDGASGLGVFYPLDNNSETVMKYMELDTSENYKQYLKAIVSNTAQYDDYTASGAWMGYSAELPFMQVYTSINNDNYYELDLIGNMSLIKTIGVNRCVFDERSGKNLSLDYDEKCDKQWESGIFTYNAVTIPMLNGKFATVRYVGWGGNYMIYSIPIIVNGEQTNLRVAKNVTDESYNVIGTWKGVDKTSGKADRFLRNVGSFKKVTPLMYSLDGSYEMPKSFFTVFGGVKLKEEKPGNGTYFLEYDIEDIYGNKLQNNGATLDVTVTGNSLHQ